MFRKAQCCSPQMFVKLVCTLMIEKRLILNMNSTTLTQLLKKFKCSIIIIIIIGHRGLKCST